MNIDDINNHFGDMDLFLMDALLKGKTGSMNNVLDLGCGSGRNGTFFIMNGFKYLGVDQETSHIHLLEYLVKESKSNVRFVNKRIQDLELEESFDLIICSQVLHLANDLYDFREMWHKIINLIAKNGVVYLSMDSIIDHRLATRLNENEWQLPDGKIRFPLTNELYDEMKKGFEEIEPIKSLVLHNHRVQSFILLKKI